MYISEKDTVQEIDPSIANRYPIDINRLSSAIDTVSEGLSLIIINLKIEVRLLLHCLFVKSFD